MLEKELALQYFHDNGWKRYRCKKCGAHFWSKKPRETCTEAPCGKYTFLDEPVFKKKYSVEEMRQEFIEFFKRHGHTWISRYPVVARWRDDVFLVNASIYDFQPHVTSGLVPPPANPLVISQPCIRMVDIDSVGKTGRHLTGFEMMAHHAFNYPDEWIYWKDETVDYALKFIDSLGGNEEDVVLKEKPWIGGGNAGASFEVIVGGLELATLVFMNLKEDENGSIVLDGIKYSEMPLKIVDTGYGLERFVWASQGTPTIYDAIYPDMISELMEILGLERGEKEDIMLRNLALLSPKIEIEDERTLIEEILKRSNASWEDYRRFIKPLQRIYAIVDYTRSLAFMLSDGIVPSNVQAGYLARLLIRRTLRLLEELNNPIPIEELVIKHIRRFGDIMDTSMIPIVEEELKLEKERYHRTISKGREIVKRMIKKKGKIDVEDLILLYDSHGLLPDMVRNIAEKMNVDVEIPKNFHGLVAKRHERMVKEKKKEERRYELPETKALYYEDPYLREFEAMVLWSRGSEVVLDQTAFYPEGGGQPADLGVIRANGEKYYVKDVQKYNGVIVHFVDREGLKKGMKIRGIIDWERRERLMRNHTAEHVLLAAARRVLGKHVWQHGTQKDVYECRFDIAHYKPISSEEIKAIEREALRIITSNIPVEARFMNRTEAEKRYGSVLYEGGIPPGKDIRVVKIGDYDVEACGGTHVRNTGEIGFLKIIRTERIQDGVSRLIYTSGLSALEHVQREEDILKGSSEKLRVQPENLEKAIERFFEEWKKYRKEVEKLKKYQIMGMKKELIEKSKDGKIAEIVDLEMEDLLLLSRELSPLLEMGVLIGKDGSIVVFGEDANKIAKEIASVMDGKAGGSKEFAQGKGDSDKRKKGLNKAKQLLGFA
ncbi:MAG: alanine--tRNA ligase [Thermoplasmata archaeon]|nr:alanine--tRNA ligase [Thermoplasmata archaeon]